MVIVSPIVFRSILKRRLILTKATLFLQSSIVLYARLLVSFCMCTGMEWWMRRVVIAWRQMLNCLLSRVSATFRLHSVISLLILVVSREARAPLIDCII